MIIVILCETLNIGDIVLQDNNEVLFPFVRGWEKHNWNIYLHSKTEYRKCRKWNITGRDGWRRRLKKMD